MTDIKIAVISDVHGNRWALESVLKKIDELGADKIVDLGDSLYGPLDPSGTADILIARNIQSVQGNEDEILLEVPADYEHRQTLDFTRENITTEHFKWLKGLQKTHLLFDEIVMCHATPESNDIYLFWDITKAGAILKSADELEKRWGTIPQQVILCGHDHKPNTIKTKKGKLFVNPGSVGLPAYKDITPYPHSMENGSPHTRFAILTKNNNDWSIENFAIEYDWTSAAKEAEKNGRPDWAKYILTGKTL